MTIDYQIIINTVCYILLISFPIALTFMIGQKLISMFTGVMFGKDINF